MKENGAEEGEIEGRGKQGREGGEPEERER